MEKPQPDKGILPTVDREEILIGHIISARGLNGWVKVFSYTDPIEQIFSYTPWNLVKNGRQTMDLVEGKVQGKHLIALLKGVEDRNQAESLMGAEIWISTDQLEELGEGEFYWHQLEGLTVVNESGEVFGDVSHLTETGANDVLIVEATPESIDDRQRLIPYVEDRVIKRVDLNSRRILVSWDADF